MGIDLGDLPLVRNPVTFHHFAGKRLAIDAWNILYQFLSSIRGPDGQPLTDAEGRITSHLNGLLHRTAAMVESGIKPVYVFDGQPHELKRETLAARGERKIKAQAEYDLAIDGAQRATDEAERQRHLQTALTKAKQTSRLTVPMVQQAQQLLRALGIPVVQAPGEGEAQASWMASAGLVDGAVSQDFDALLFGAPVLVRHLASGGRRKMPGKQVWVDVAPEEIHLQTSLGALGLTREQLVDAALLVGTDFNPGVKGIGAKKAVALIAREGSLEALLARLDASPGTATGAVERQIVTQREALADREEVRRIFLNPAHTATGELNLRGPDEAAVRDLLVGQHGFQAPRVDAALARYAAARGKQAQKTLF